MNNKNNVIDFLSKKIAAHPDAHQLARKPRKKNLGIKLVAIVITFYVVLFLASMIVIALL